MCVKQIPKCFYTLATVLDRDALKEYRRHQHVEGGVHTA